MTWEEKQELVNLGNQMNSGDLDINKRITFCDYVLEKIDSFDIQAWDMYITIENVLEINEDVKFIPYYKKVSELIGPEPVGFKFDCHFRTMIRLDLFRDVINQYLNKINNTETNGN